MHNKSVRFGRAIVLSIFFFITIFSLPGAGHNTGSIWKNIHVGAGSLLLIASTVHLIKNLKWLKTVSSRPAKTLPGRVRLNRAIDLSMAISSAICMLTGMHWLIDPQGVVNHLHDLSGAALIILLSIHLLLHWQWMVDTARQMRQPQSEKAHRPAQETMPLE